MKTKLPPRAMAEPAIPVPPPPQIPRRPELASQIHPSPASPNSCATLPYTSGPECASGAGDQHVVPAKAPAPPPPLSPPAPFPTASPATTSSTKPTLSIGLTPPKTLHPLMAADRPPSPTLSATVEDDVELLDWGDDDDADEEEALQGESVAGLDALPSEPSSRPAPCTPGSGGSPMWASAARAGAPDSAARPAVFTADMDLKVSAPHPGAFLAASIHAGSTETASIHPLHAGSEVGASPAISSHPPPPPTRAGATEAPKLKSVLVVPDRKPPSPVHHRKPVWRLLDSNSGPFNQQDGCLATGPSTLPSQGPWQPAKARRRVRQEAAPLRAAMAKQEKARSAAREAFKRRLVGRCYRCFASDHLLAQCREPVRCWECLGVGHFARHCSARRKPISADLRARITFPPNNIHSRITFPPLTQNSSPSDQSSPQSTSIHQVPHQPSNQSTPKLMPNHQARQLSLGAREYIPQNLQYPARLRTHAVVISAPQEAYHAAVPEVAHALWGQLRVPVNDIKVTNYGPDLFLAEFGSPAERDSAMMMGVVEIGGAAFPIAPWRSDGGSTESSWCYHVKATWVRDDNGQLHPGCSRSPPTYRQALMGESEPRDGELQRGRTMSRSPTQAGWQRDILEHASHKRERRRSRSTTRRLSVHSTTASQEQLGHDPLVEEMAAYEPHREDRAFDPMVQESQELRSPAQRCYSLEDDMDGVESPVRKPLLNSSPTGVVLEQAEGEVFSNGVQQQAANKVTHMDLHTLASSGMILEQLDGAASFEDAGEQTKILGVVEDEEIEDDDGQGACAAFCRKMFKEAAAPLLPRPQTLPRRGGRGRKKLMVATRSSLRLAARPSAVPVAQRAQRKLMRELQFMEPSAGPPDAAATEYLDLYGQDLSEEAVDKIRVAARLGNKKLAEALAAVAAEMGAPDPEMEFL